MNEDPLVVELRTRLDKAENVICDIYHQMSEAFNSKRYSIYMKRIGDIIATHKKGLD